MPEYPARLERERTPVRREPAPPPPPPDNTPPYAFRRKRFEWHLRRRKIALGERTLLIGVLDLSPEGPANGRYQDPDRALAKAIELTSQGAAMIEVAPAPLAAGHAMVADAEEIRRCVPVFKRLRNELDVPVAVQTIHPLVVEKAAEYEAEALMNPDGLTVHPAVAKVASAADLGMLLGHMRGKPETWPKISPLRDAPRAVATALNASLSRAIRDGVDRHRLAVDPGLGHGKRREQDYDLLAFPLELRKLEIPYCYSPLSGAFGLDPANTGALTAAVTAAALGGAHMVRVTDVATAREALLMADAIIGADTR